MPPPAPEPWLRGPIEGVPPLLMPAAHALLQAREDVEHVLQSLTTGELWQRPGASSRRRTCSTSSSTLPSTPPG